MPASTSSNTMQRVACAAPDTCTASDSRASSPPEATLASARGGCPGLAVTRNSMLSIPCSVGSALPFWVTSASKRPPDMPSVCMRAEMSRESSREVRTRLAESSWACVR